MNQDQQQSGIELLQAEWALLRAALDTLQLSVNKCQGIGNKVHYTFEEQESFDSLTSKFNRASDIFTQKAIRTLWLLLHEPFMPFIDVMNKCEKMSIIQSADQMLEIRDLRNQIAHEYLPDAIQELVPEVIDLSAHLHDNALSCYNFLLQRN
jgi:L-2-hydroxyglutarate oxidase LhgO